MTRYGCGSCNGSWEEEHEAIAQCYHSRKDTVVFECPCRRYRHCNLGDFITKHIKGCDEGRAVLEGGLTVTNRNYQNVILHCSRHKSVGLTYSMEIEEGAKEEEQGDSMPRLLGRRRRSISSSSRAAPAVVAATRPSSPSPSYPTKQMPNSSGPSASPVTLASLGLPPPGPVLSSLLGEDATHTDFDGFFSNSTAASLKIASSSSGNRPNSEFEAPVHIPSTSPAVINSARKGATAQILSEPTCTTIGQQHEEPSQMNVSAIPDIIIDLTNDDDAPADGTATVNTNTLPRLEHRTQVNGTTTRRRRNDSILPAGNAAAAQDGRLASDRLTRATAGGRRASRASHTATSGTAVLTMPTAEGLANAMPLSRYGPLGVPRKVDKKNGIQ